MCGYMHMKGLHFLTDEVFMPPRERVAGIKRFRYLQSLSGNESATKTNTHNPCRVFDDLIDVASPLHATTT